MLLLRRLNRQRIKRKGKRHPRKAMLDAEEKNSAAERVLPKRSVERPDLYRELSFLVPPLTVFVPSSEQTYLSLSNIKTSHKLFFKVSLRKT